MKKFIKKTIDRDIKFIVRDWEEVHGVTLAFVAFNEDKNIEKMVSNIRPVVKRVVAVDNGSTDDTVDVLKKFSDTFISIPFCGHYGNIKNRAIELSYTDWTLLMDPDEMLTEGLIKKIPEYINQNEYDAFSFPRKEIRDGEEDVSVYPDRQVRLFRTYCRYVRPVHEELVGHKKLFNVPQDSELDIIHEKSNSRHEERNLGHTIFSINYTHELGAPGEQLEDSFNKRPTEKDVLGG